MHAALRAEGHRCSRGRVERVMRHHGIQALAGREFCPCATGRRHFLAPRKIVGWAMRDHLRTDLTLCALMMAAQRQRPGRGLVHPSDPSAVC